MQERFGTGLQHFILYYKFISTLIGHVRAVVTCRTGSRVSNSLQPTLYSIPLAWCLRKYGRTSCIDLRHREGSCQLPLLLQDRVRPSDKHRLIATSTAMDHKPATIELTLNYSSFSTPCRACRHGDRCSRLHNKPTISQTILIPNMYQNPVLNAPLGPDGLPVQVAPEEVMEHYEVGQEPGTTAACINVSSGSTCACGCIALSPSSYHQA